MPLISKLQISQWLPSAVKPGSLEKLASHQALKMSEVLADSPGELSDPRIVQDTGTYLHGQDPEVKLISANLPPCHCI